MPSANGCATSPSWRTGASRRPRRSRPRTERARPRSPRRPSARWRRSNGSHRSWRVRAKSCATSSCGCARSAAICARFLASLESEPDRVEQVESELERIADARRRFGATELRRPARARRGSRAGSSRRWTGGLDPTAAAAEALGDGRGDVGATRSEPSCDTREPPPSRSPLRSPTSCAGSAWATASSASSCASASPAHPGRDEAVFLIRPNAGLPVRAGRGDRLGRRALARRARDRRGRGRRDARLRRDRRRHRRRDRARGRGDAGAARRARAGDHDHPPAPDRERRRRALPRREDARRPDPHADRECSPTRSAATSSSACSAARSSSRRSRPSSI